VCGGNGLCGGGGGGGVWAIFSALALKKASIDSSYFGGVFIFVTRRGAADHRVYCEAD
jgi:hypothetical protein